jgi:hypothetical protein
MQKPEVERGSEASRNDYEAGEGSARDREAETDSERDPEGRGAGEVEALPPV